MDIADKYEIRVVWSEVDGGFGLRAFVPTFRVEWQKEVAARRSYLNKE